MAVLRQFNALGQERLDIPHIRSIESAVCADFDLLVGLALCGQRSVVVNGFKFSIPGAIGGAASALQVVTAGGVVFHYNGSESGTMYLTPADRAVEVLSPTNSRVTGSFTANAVNYVGIDIRRSADDSTSDTAQFLDADTLKETPKTVPLGRTTDYAFIISTADFSTTPAVAPLAIVTTDVANNVVSVQDARERLYRLGRGGSVPSSTYAFPWAEGRLENTTGEVFSGGDKVIASFKDWADAVMTRLWELGGGERWFSSTADRNIKMLRLGSFFSNGEYFEWDGSNLHWKGLKIVFPNSSGWYNDIANQTSDSAGLTDLADGECIYVDIDYTQNRTGGSALVAQKATAKLLGSPTIPGGRFIVAWRSGAAVFTRDAPWPVGTHFTPATTTSLGVVKLSKTPIDPANPVVLTNTERDAANGVAALDGSLQTITTGLVRTGHGGGDIVIGNDGLVARLQISTLDEIWVANESVRGTAGYVLLVEQATQLFSLNNDGDAALRGTLTAASHKGLESPATSPTGNYGSFYQSGSGTGTITPTAAGTFPTSSVSGGQWYFRVKIVVGGGVGVGTYQFSRDGGITFTSTATIPATYTDSTSGLKIAFSGTFNAGDQYSWRPRFSPLWTGRDAAGHVHSVIDHNGFIMGRVSSVDEQWTDYGWSAATSTGTHLRWVLSTTDNITVSTHAADSTFGAPYMSLNKTGAVNNDQGALDSIAWVNLSEDVVAVAEWEMQVNTTNTTFQVGWRGGTAITADGIYFEKTAPGSAWNCVATDGGGTTSVATNYITPGEAGGSVGRFRIEVRGANIDGTRAAYFWINEDLVAVITTHVVNAARGWSYTTKATGAVNLSGNFGPLRAVWSRMLSAPAL